MKKTQTDTFISRRFDILFIFACALCIALGGVFWTGSKAQNKSKEKPAETKPTQAEDLKEDLKEEFSRLIRVAQERGSVRVIIGLKVDFKPIGELSKQAQSRQKSNIKKAQDDLLLRLKSYEVKEVKQFEFIPFLAAEVDAGALEKMRDDENVTSIQEDKPDAPSLAQSIPIVGATAAWTAGFSGAGWAVAVLDTGVDKTHSFLSGRVVSEACYSSNNGATASSVCPGGVTQSTASNSALNCNLAVNGCNHGTHVAGIAAGRSTTSNGVAKDANIIAVQVFSNFPSQTDCGSNPAPCALSYTSDQILGLQRVLALSGSINIAAVNMSLGGGQFFSNCDATEAGRKAAIDNLRSVGIATVISSGNSSYTNAMGAPGCISTAVSVGSTGDGSGGATLNVVSSFSNSVSFLNLLAPGAVITSSVPGGGFANFQGTSMAAPHVAGAWAVLKQKKPTATVTEVLNAFVSTGQSITDSRNNIVKPRIRVDSALAAISANCGSTAINVGQTVNGNLQTGDCLYTDNTLYDAYTFSGTAGQQIAVSMNSAQFNSYLFLYQGAYPGGTIVSSDDNGGGGNNARIPATTGFITLPATGTYTILANGFSTTDTGAYSLSLLSNVPSVCDQLTPLTLNQTINGTLTTSDCIVGSNYYTDKYSFSGTTGQQVIISMNSTAVDSYLLLYNPGNLLLTEDNNGGGGNNARIPAVSGSYTLPATGTYTIEASTFPAFQTGAYSVTLSPGTVPPAGRRPFDFDNDGKTDFGIYRPSNGQWWIQRSSNNSVFAATFGNSADKIVPADYTGDGLTDIAVWRPSTGEWFILRSENGTYYSGAFGTNGDIPAPGDFDLDGKADLVLFRPSQGVWYIFNSSNLSVSTILFGQSGDVPVTADYDGDGRSDAAVFRPSTGVWWLRRSSLGVVAFQFGNAADKPAPGDYSGDGKADVAFFRPSTGEWYILRSENQTYYSGNFGANGDIPVPGDYDGDGKNDPAVFRPSNSTWYVQRSTNINSPLIQTFGIAGDKPVPSAFVP
jgi:subtilisin